MPSDVMDQRRMSSSSYFYDERLPAQRQVGFWKNNEPIHDHHGNMSAVSSTMEKLLPIGAQHAESLNLSQSSLLRDQKPKFTAPEKTANLSMPPWGLIDQDRGRSNMLVRPSSYFTGGNKIDRSHLQYENSLFSSSLSEIFNTKMKLSSNDVLFGQSADAVNSQREDEEALKSLEEIEAQTIGNFLPDDEDLLSGLLDDLEYVVQPNNGDDIEDFDLFSSGGGMELGDDMGQRGSDFAGGISNSQTSGQNGVIAGEHPYGEHPSRTLFVRNINSNVEDSELMALFQQYGDIRTLYTACKHRGFVMISYYDIRAARSAMRSLQNKPLRRRKLDIHYSIPKDNPSERDVNQGTLVVFNLDSSVSNDELCHIFGVYGEIKEIRETPHKRHHKFIEFYDVRAADAALRALNRTDIAGKRIKLEPSRPGGARRVMQQLSPELEQEESASCQLEGSPPNLSPSACLDSVPLGVMASDSMEHGVIQGLKSAMRATINRFNENGLHHGLSSSVPHNLPSPARIASVGHQSSFGDSSHLMAQMGQMKYGFQCAPNFHPQSLPEYHDSLVNGAPYSSPGNMAGNISSGPLEGIDKRYIHRVSADGQPLEFNEDGGFPISGHHYLWNNSASYHPHPPNSMVLPNSPSFVNGVHAHPAPRLHGLPRAPSHMMNAPFAMHHHHVGSAPAINPSLWDRRHAFAAESPETSGFHPGSFGSVGLSASNLNHLGLASHNLFHHVGGNCMEPSLGSPNIGLHSPQQRFHMLPPRNQMIHMPNSFDSPNERMRSRRNEITSNQVDNKKQYELDIDRIVNGEDTRTTLMIKNIPNKYTSKMLLAAIDENHRGTYDFIYLPIDFKNKCNVGYAFINMIDPRQIVPFYEAFNGKKWEKFNSEKVASLAYARIQGKAALVAHFQNSSLMNEDKRCRPILFHSDGPNAGDQEPFPMGVNIRSRVGRARTFGFDENQQESPSASAIIEESSSLLESS
ncbi:hypothetical protein Syun_024623 [Stephania yunnanensis]|uniref:RRM domain-containing protein n=1 Tax=Stephania yunnanensis TaxID=152371 RepID=A0AAP0I4P6_9MAGN